MSSRHTHSRPLASLGVAAIAGLALSLAAPLAATAHVTIDPQAAEPGSYTIIDVRVPNESATATTNRIELTLPEDTPFQSVRYVPVAGWSVELVTTTFDSPVEVGDREITKAVTRVIWTADAGAEISDGELQLFALSVGPVPDTGKIVMPVQQTYTDGTVVDWSQTEADAEYPAPVLFVNDAPEADDHGAADSDESHESEPVAGTSAGPADGADPVARGLGVAGLVLGAGP